MTMIEEYIPPMTRTLVLLSSGVVMLWAYMTYLPFYSPTINYLHAAFAGVFTWAALCLLTAVVRDQNEVCVL